MWGQQWQVGSAETVRHCLSKGHVHLVYSIGSFYRSLCTCKQGSRCHSSAQYCCSMDISIAMVVHALCEPYMLGVCVLLMLKVSRCVQQLVL